MQYNSYLAGYPIGQPADSAQPGGIETLRELLDQDPRAASEEARRILVRAEAQPDDRRTRAAALAILSMAMNRMGHQAKSASEARRALDILKSDQSVTNWPEALIADVVAGLAETGQLAEASALTSEFPAVAPLLRTDQLLLIIRSDVIDDEARLVILNRAVDGRRNLELWTSLGAIAERTGHHQLASDAFANAGLYAGLAAQYEEAVDLLERALSLDPARLDAQLWVAIALQILGRNAEAIEHCKRVLAVHPNDTQAIATYVAALRSIDPEQSNAVLAIAMDNLGPDPWLDAERVRSLVAQGDADALIHFVDALAKRSSPESMTEILGQAVEAQLSAAQDPTAVEDRLLELAPERRQLLAALRLDYGVAAYEAQDRDTAARDLNRALVLDPELGKAHFYLGEILRLDGKFERALGHLEEAVGIEEVRALALGTRGQIRNAMGDRISAERDLLAALAENADLSWAEVELSEVYRLDGRPSEARAHARRATELDPEDAWAWACLALAERSLNMFADALTSFERALSLEPDYEYARVMRAGVLIDLDRLEEASTELSRTPEDSTMGLRYTLIGQVHELVGGDIESFAGAYERAYELDPEDFETLTNLASLRARQNRISEANVLWHRVLSLLPTDREMDAYELAVHGWALMWLGEYEAAAASLGAASAIGSLDSVTFDLGLDLLLWGRSEDALDRYTQAVDGLRAVDEVGRQRYLQRMARSDLSLAAIHPGIPDAKVRQQIEDILDRVPLRVRERRRGRSSIDTRGIPLSGAR